MTFVPQSKIYQGRVFHQRLRPRKHRLSYRVFSLFLDLEELPQLAAQHRFFSHNRFNILSFWDKDYGDGRQGKDGHTLLDYVRTVLQDAGYALPGGAVRMLCYPRMFGYVFNPLSVYYCYDAEGVLRVLLYEVSNTFGQRHSYLIPVSEDQNQVIRQRCRKDFYVSPFIDTAGDYEFRLSLPKESLTLLINHRDAEGVLLKASFSGQAVMFTDRTLAALVWKYPLMTVKVIAGIHWEALKLWKKGLHFFRRPQPPKNPLTIVKSDTLETQS